MEIKLTPFIMFLIILAVLIFSMIFGHYFVAKDRKELREIENFNSFEFGTYGGQNINRLDTVIPWYSSKTDGIYVLYDSILFDLKNGNLIEVYDTVNGNIQTGNLKNTSTLNNIWVNTRFQNQTTVDMSTQNKNADKWDKKTQSSTTPYVYYSQASSQEHYTVIYVPFGQETYIHIIGKTSITNGQTNNILSLYGSSSANQILSPVVYNNPYNITPSAPITADSKYDNINGFTPPSGYYDKNAHLYSLNKNIFYDCDKGIVCITDLVGNTKYYDRINGSIVTISSSYTYNQKPGQFNSWMTLSDPYVLCMTCGQETVIVYLASDSRGKLIINNYALFNNTISSSNNQTFVGGNIPRDTSVTKSPPGQNSKDISNYLINNPELFFSTCGSDKTKWNYNCMQAFYNIANPNGVTDFDYIKKTEIVPPVCPMCPNCPGSGVCTYCGGAGGSGTGGSYKYIDQCGNVIVINGKNENKNNYTSVGSGTLVSTADPDTIGGALTLGQLDLVAGIEDVAKTGSGVINKTVDTAGNLAGKLVDKTTDLVGGVASGTGALIGAAGLGAYDLIKGAGQGAYDLTKGAGQGAYNLTKGAGQGAYKLIHDNGVGGGGRTSQGQSKGIDNDLSRSGYYNSYNQTGKPVAANIVDNYSYYGALPSKGDEKFIPVTADFSSFRK